jgi:hypothetical protein
VDTPALVGVGDRSGIAVDVRERNVAETGSRVGFVDGVDIRVGD